MPHPHNIDGSTVLWLVVLSWIAGFFGYAVAGAQDLPRLFIVTMIYGAGVSYVGYHHWRTANHHQAVMVSSWWFFLLGLLLGSLYGGGLTPAGWIISGYCSGTALCLFGLSLFGRLFQSRHV